MKKRFWLIVLLVILPVIAHRAHGLTVVVENWQELQDAIDQKETYIQLSQDIDGAGTSFDIDYVLYLDGNGKTLSNISFNIIHTNVYIVGDLTLQYEVYAAMPAFTLKATGSAANRSQLFVQAPLKIEGIFQEAVFAIGDRGHLIGNGPITLTGEIAAGSASKAFIALNGSNGSFSSADSLIIQSMSTGARGIASTGSQNTGSLGGSISLTNMYRGIELSGQDRWTIEGNAVVHIGLQENGQESFYTAGLAVLNVADNVTWRVKSMGTIQAGGKVLGSSTFEAGEGFHFCVDTPAVYGLLHFSNQLLQIGAQSRIELNKVITNGIYANKMTIGEQSFFYCEVEGNTAQLPTAVFAEDEILWNEGAALYIKSNYALFGGKVVVKAPEKLQGQSLLHIVQGNGTLYLHEPEDFDIKIYPLPIQAADTFQKVFLNTDSGFYLWDRPYYYDTALDWTAAQTVNTQGTDVFIPGDMQYPSYNGFVGTPAFRIATNHPADLFQIEIEYVQKGRIVGMERLFFPVGATITTEDFNIPPGYYLEDNSFVWRVVKNRVISVEVYGGSNSGQDSQESSEQNKTEPKDVLKQPPAILPEAIVHEENLNNSDRLFYQYDKSKIAGPKAIRCRKKCQE